MLRKILFLFIGSAIITACSSDNNNDNNSEPSIIGTWHMTGINVDSEANTGQLQFASLAIESLLKDNCELLVFVFNADASLTSTDKIQNLDISITSDGITVPCPTETTTTNSTWNLEGDRLTITDADGMGETATIDLKNNTLTIAGESIGNDLYTGADVVFTKQ